RVRASDIGPPGRVQAPGELVVWSVAPDVSATAPQGCGQRKRGQGGARRGGDLDERDGPDIDLGAVHPDDAHGDRVDVGEVDEVQAGIAERELVDARRGEAHGVG